jgi:hypothetical protein
MGDDFTTRRKRGHLVLRAAVEDGDYPPYRVPVEAPFRFAFALGDRRYSTHTRR